MTDSDPEVPMVDSLPLAWVESPLQLIGAAEWAHAHRVRVPVAGRLTAQMSSTADELIARGAPFGETHPFLGIPWTLLARHRHWLVGDGFSGQFRLAAAVLRPQRITFLDDGANALPFADVILARRRYARPGVAEGRVSALLAPFALHTVDSRAARGGVDFFTAFDFGAARRAALAERGVPALTHDFAFTRSHRRPTALPSRRVVLGSAGPADGRITDGAYLRWVRAEAASGDISYLPHRREPAHQRAAAAAVPGVHLVDTGLPVELALAGADAALEIVTLPSSTATTLPLVLAGTGSTVRVRRVSDADVAGVRR